MNVQSNIEQLKKYSTCEISDALLKLKHPRGGFVAGISMWSPERQAGSTKIIGPAHTVRFALHTETDAPKPQGHYVDDIPAGAVIVSAIPKGVENGCWGGLMAHRARFQGAAGLVLDGNLRDLDEQRRLEFPVFARGVATPAYMEVCHPSEVNVPIELQDGRTTVCPGDLIVADLNGVVCIPQGLTTDVLGLIVRMAEADAKMEAAIDSGATFAEASRQYRNLY